CLLHEKPFAGVNGSGKHNNWSISTNTGANLLEPGSSPHDNAQFLLILCAVIQAVDDYQDLLRMSVATPGNDHRLGANEAPPAIVSMFLGDELTEILEAIESDSAYQGHGKTEMEIGVDVLPHFPRDTTDRNRTSPFAFTGNKFEFRMPGSSLSIAGPNIILNTIVADALAQFADRLEGAQDFKQELSNLIKDTIRQHKRIIFNGNNYSDDWVKEAEGRGLVNLKSTPEALRCMVSEKNVALFERHNVFSATELHARMEIMLANYCKVLTIEALTMLEMVRKEILPATERYVRDLTDTALAKRSLSATLPCEVEERLVAKLSSLCACLYNQADKLDGILLEAHACTCLQQQADFYRAQVFTAMQEMRAIADEIETMVGQDYWPYPTYGELLFYV
nr:glutamine synthetase type III [bacterium]